MPKKAKLAKRQKSLQALELDDYSFDWNTKPSFQKKCDTSENDSSSVGTNFILILLPLLLLRLGNLRMYKTFRKMKLSLLKKRKSLRRKKN